MAAKESDQYEWVTAYLKGRGLQAVWQNATFAFVAPQAALPLLTLWSPTGPADATSGAASVVISVLGCAGATLWLRRWPTRRESILFRWVRWPENQVCHHPALVPGMDRRRFRVEKAMTDRIELSPTGWVREQTEQILQQGTTDGVEILDRPVVLVTTTGAKSGKQRYVPLMRVEKDGRYAMVASKGGAPAHPSWYFNVKTNPAVTVQDGDEVVALTARELEGSEREQWWRLAVDAFPPYAEYQTKTARQIPVFVLE
jgi:F420H(2)-dependent quinone reductase